MQAQMYIHIGYQKCASSTLQHNIFPNIRGVDYLGRYYNRPQSYISAGLIETVEKIGLIDSVEYDADTIKRKIAEAIEPLNKAGNKLLLSNEGFSANYVDRGIIADRLLEMFSNARILIVIRNQEEILASMYTYIVSQGGAGGNVSYGRPSTKSFEKWVVNQEEAYNISFLCTLNYYKFAKLYVDRFGVNNVKILLLEDLEKSKDSFKCALAEFFGVDAVSVEFETNSGRQNPRPSQRRLIYNKLRYKFTRGRPIGDKMPPFLASFWRSVIDSGPSPLCKLTEQTRKRVLDRYREGNRLLNEEFGLDVGRYGYPL